MVELPERATLRLMADWLLEGMTLSGEAMQQVLRATSLEGEAGESAGSGRW